MAFFLVKSWVILDWSGSYIDANLEGKNLRIHNQDRKQPKKVKIILIKTWLDGYLNWRTRVIDEKSQPYDYNESQTRSIERTS